MLGDELEAHLRMRKCLAGVLDLDPAGISERLAETDREIERLRSLLEPGEPKHEPFGSSLMEIVSIGRRAKAA